MAKRPHIYTIRNKKVVLDRELAATLGVETRRMNEQIKRNKEKFFSDSVFQLTKEEWQNLSNFGLMPKIATSNNTGRGGVRKLPFVFTESGVRVLKTLMKSSVEFEFEEEVIEAEVLPESWNEGTVVLYQPNEDIKIDVRVENETVWLTQEQMALLFGTTTQNITTHIGNIFYEKEVEERATCKDFLQVQIEGDREVRRNVKLYNLDVIISVGYRVKSIQGTRFRQWALKIIKGTLLHRHYYDSRIDKMEQTISDNTSRIKSLEQKVEFIVDTKIPPIEQIFMQGQFFDAYKLFSDLIRSANKRVIIIDNYVDESVLELLRKRKAGVEGVIYTSEKCYSNNNFKIDLQKFNAQYPSIEVQPMSKVHDRFMIIDDTLYSSGGSFKDAGKKLFSFEKMELNPDAILKLIGV